MKQRYNMGYGIYKTKPKQCRKVAARMIYAWDWRMSESETYYAMLNGFYIHVTWKIMNIYESAFLWCIYICIYTLYICIICMYNMYIYIYVCVYPVPHVWADATEIRMDYNWPTCVLNYYFTCLNEEMLRLVVTSYFNNSLLKLGFMGHFTSKNGGLEWSSFCNYNPWRCTYHYQPTISAENG